MESRGYLYTALSFNSTKQNQRDCFPTLPPPPSHNDFQICQQLQPCSPFLAGRLMMGDAVTCRRVESGRLRSGVDAPCEMSTWPFLQECTEALEGSTKGALLQGLGGLFPGPVWCSRSVLKGSNSLSHGRSVSQPHWGSAPCQPLQMEPSLCSLHSPSPGWSRLLSVPCPGSGCALCPECPSSVHLPFEGLTQGFSPLGGTLSNHGQSV